MSVRLPRALAPFLTALVTVTCLVLPVQAAPPSASFQAADEREVLAYYYAWWDPHNFDVTLFKPTEPYNSDDPAIMQRHIQQAKVAGITAFVSSWHGNGDRTDTNLAHLLDLAAQNDFEATIHFQTPLFWGVEDTIAQLQAFYALRIDHPAMLRYQGRPVIFFWRAATYSNATWDEIRAQVDPEHRALWIADGDNFSILSGGAWDGISPYAIAWSPNPAAQLPSWASRAQAVAPEKLWIPPVSPGCDDSAARATTCLMDRAAGAYYQATWDGALASGPSWAVIVSTFNEWLESTQIEPSPDYGDFYLEITRLNSDAFRQPAS